MAQGEYEFLYDDSIVLREELTYGASPAAPVSIPPQMGRIVDYPVIQRVKELIVSQGILSSQSVNQYHSRLEARSGNVKLTLTFTLPINCQRGDNLINYLDNEKISHMVANGIIYEFVD